MNRAMISFILGWILLCLGALMTLPLAVALIYRESAGISIAVTMLISLALGLLMTVGRRPKDRTLYLRDGFFITAVTWIVISFIGSLPFVFSGAIPHLVDALFETVSGFTTTGASILSDVESMPRCLLFWRSFTHWIGGMGVLVFLLSLLPLTGGTHVNLMKAESPGPQVEKLAPTVQSTAKILYSIYIALTLLEIVMLLLGGMSLFDSVTLSFGTAGTGGFGIRNDSIASYSTYCQNVIGVFMILFGINFNFYFYLLLRKVQRAFDMEEVRMYLWIVGVAVLAIALNIVPIYQNGWLALQRAFFQVSSIITTTGYTTADFDLWPEFSKGVLVLLMFVGACAGSTGGGIKVSRCLILMRTMRKELKRLLHPQSVEKISLDGKPVAHETLRSMNVFMVTYILVFIVSILLISLNEFDFTTNFTAVAATLNNIGPGLNLVGPTQNFALYSSGAKLVLIFDMLAGRLELFPMMLLFSKQTWRRF